MINIKSMVYLFLFRHIRSREFRFKIYIKHKHVKSIITFVRVQFIYHGYTILISIIKKYYY